jgi:hypothetical protein
MRPKAGVKTIRLTRAVKNAWQAGISTGLGELPPWH